MAYNNIKNANIDYISFGLNYSYYLWVLFKNKTNFYLKFYFVDKQTKKLKDLMSIYQQNRFHAQELWIKVYDKRVKPKSYILDKKILLNNKYIKTKPN